MYDISSAAAAQNFTKPYRKQVLYILYQVGDDQQQIWRPRSLIGCGIFDFSVTASYYFTKPNRKQVPKVLYQIGHFQPFVIISDNMITRGLMVLSMAVLPVAYYLYTPMPPQCKEPNRQRVIVAMSKIINLLNRFLDVTKVGSHASGWRAVFNISTKESDPMLEIEDVQFDGVPVRIYKRVERGQKLTAGAIYIHGGGFVFGSRDTHDSPVRKIALSTDPYLTVSSIEYRLAPEYRYPAAFDDCYSATKHFLTHAKDHGVDPKRIALIGDSAGGALVAAVINKLISENVQPRPSLQVLIYPTLQGLNFRTPSYLAHDGTKNRGMLTAYPMVCFWLEYAFGTCENASLYLQNTHVSDHMRQSYPYLFSSRLDSEEIQTKPVNENLPRDIEESVNRIFLSPYYSPLLASDDILKNIPKTFISTCDFDPLRDEAEYYAERLKKLGIPHLHKHYHGYDHGIFAVEFYKGSAVIQADVMNFIKENL
ncbi:hypothetical protein FSP39_018161 [Pinctada imbricata]|uniref:Alpha/beta hydrolase fold-3 domain-containing protein n=1 Tax=Pinctada imbricata TaxID=66713 RepID=A0AA89BM88_PINIB|nr:hypothetical protein FSP39_018161 [Pinctada imbricata]